jgi:hypothetical protein
MPGLEQIEIARYRKEIDDDLRHILKKYCRIMGWEVPELDEQAARKLIIAAVKESLAELEVNP